MLEKFHLSRYRKTNPRDLSSGERQRVALASVLVTGTRLIILDEPTRGVDFRLKAELGKFLQKETEKGGTIIVVTHDVEFAAEFAVRAVMMFSGRIAKDGGYILTGKKESARGGYDIYVVKTDKNGDPVWEKTIEDTGCNSSYAILQSKDGGCVVAGRKGIEKSAGSDILLLKLKSESKLNATLLWLIGIAAIVLVGALLFLLKRRRRLAPSVTTSS